MVNSHSNEAKARIVVVCRILMGNYCCYQAKHRIGSAIIDEEEVMIMDINVSKARCECGHMGVVRETTVGVF